MPRHRTLVHRAAHACSNSIASSKNSTALLSVGSLVGEKTRNCSPQSSASASPVPKKAAAAAASRPNPPFPLSFLYPPSCFSSRAFSSSTCLTATDSAHDERTRHFRTRRTHTFSFVSNTAAPSEMQHMRRQQELSSTPRTDGAGPSSMPLTRVSSSRTSKATQYLPAESQVRRTKALGKEPMSWIQHAAVCKHLMEAEEVQEQDVASARSLLRAQHIWTTAADDHHHNSQRQSRKGLRDSLQSHERLYLPLAQSLLNRDRAAPVPAAMVLNDMFLVTGQTRHSHSDSPRCSSAAAWATSRTLELCLCVSENGVDPMFRSSLHRTAAHQLWTTAHENGWSPDKPSWTRYIRAVLADGQLKDGAILFAEQARAAQRTQSSSHKSKGKPFPSSKVLIHLRALLRYASHSVKDRQGNPQTREISRALLQEYGSALAVLTVMLKEGSFPWPADEDPSSTGIHADNVRSERTASIAWLVARLVDFDHLSRRAQLRQDMPTGIDASILALVRTIRKTMAAYMQELLESGPPTQLSFDQSSFNSLMHYALDVLHDHELCCGLVTHMSSVRKPPLPITSVTRNIILTHATRQQLPELAVAVLDLDGRNVLSTMAELGDDAPIGREPAGLSRSATLSVHLTQARARGDTHRLVALLQHIASSGQLTACTSGTTDLDRRRPHLLDAKRLVFLVLPELDRIRPFRRRGGRRVRIRQVAVLRGSPVTGSPAYTGLYPVSRDFHVLTAALKVCVKAGLTGLAAKVWGMLKRRTAIGSSTVQPLLQGGRVVVRHIPLQAATLLMQLCVDERSKGVKLLRRLPLVAGPSPPHQSAAVRRAQIRSHQRALRQYALQHPRHFRQGGWRPFFWSRTRDRLRKKSDRNLYFRLRIRRPLGRYRHRPTRRAEPKVTAMKLVHRSCNPRLSQLRALVAVRVAAKEYLAIRARWGWTALPSVVLQPADQMTWVRSETSGPTPDAFFFRMALRALAPPSTAATRADHTVFRECLRKTGVDWVHALRCLREDMVAHGFASDVPSWLNMELGTAAA